MKKNREKVRVENKGIKAQKAKDGKKLTAYKYKQRK